MIYNFEEHEKATNALFIVYIMQIMHGANCKLIGADQILQWILATCQDAAMHEDNAHSGHSNFLTALYLCLPF